jgi:benzoyl-CoA reductase/2-hydroxyglutaryl-CoA dehydratase subunit BcrC/BadD/HgdB
MIELLKMCGFEVDEAAAELPRIEKVFNRLGITAENIERGKQRLTKYYDIELEGVRKLFRLCVRELVDSLLAREEGKKGVIYGFMSPGIELLGSALVSKSKEVSAVHHSWAFQIIVGCVFDKIVPVIEAAERKWLKAGAVAHCANIKTLVGPFALGLFPKPDLMVTSGFTCEAAPKTIDLLHELYDMPIYCIDTCQDRELSEYPNPTKRTVELTAKSLRRLAGRMQEIVGFEITDDMLLEVLDAKGKFNDALGRLRDLVASSDPLVLSPTLENIWMGLNMFTLSIDGIAEATKAINTLYEELQERVEKGLGVVEKGAPRILAILPAGQTDPRLEYLACELGIAIVAIDMGFRLPYEEKSKDPYISFAMDSQQHSIALTLPGRIPLIIEGCKRLNVDGVLDRFHVGCRSVAGDALLIKDAITRELGIPVLLLEWENFDPRVYNHEQYKRRLEVFKTMLVKRAI